MENVLQMLKICLKSHCVILVGTRLSSPASFLHQTELTSKLDQIHPGASSSQILNIFEDIQYIFATDLWDG